MIALFGLFAEVERDLISERTKEGLAAAKAKGKLLGRRSPSALDANDIGGQGRGCFGEGNEGSLVVGRGCHEGVSSAR